MTLVYDMDGCRLVSLVTHNESLWQRRRCITYWGRDKMPPFCWDHFPIFFLEWRPLNFDSNFIEVCLLKKVSFDRNEYCLTYCLGDEHEPNHYLNLFWSISVANICVTEIKGQELPTPHKTYRTRAPAIKPGSSWEKVHIKSSHSPFKSQIYSNSIDRVVLCQLVWYYDHMTSKSCRKS